MNVDEFVIYLDEQIILFDTKLDIDNGPITKVNESLVAMLKTIRKKALEKGIDECKKFIDIRIDYFNKANPTNFIVSMINETSLEVLEDLSEKISDVVE